MADFLELGFNWLDVGKTGTLSYGWSTNDPNDGNDGWRARPGTSDTVDPAHGFSFIIAETSETPGIVLVFYEITFKSKPGNPINNPITNQGWETHGDSQRILQGDLNIALGGSTHLPGLAQQGNYTTLDSLDFNQSLKNRSNVPHPYEVTISITAAKGEETGTWAVDPELIIGGRG